ncbi:MAG TPA: hypothetical protein RMI62_28235, partial [Polyangiaceae bacterium LLY-WYZ-15_(1-7)]|nr:hypothetical protein [Polyangiaceae bacterium LLY-WYZ-15_(1-7)]
HWADAVDETAGTARAAARRERTWARFMGRFLMVTTALMWSKTGARGERFTSRTESLRKAESLTPIDGQRGAIAERS